MRTLTEINQKIYWFRIANAQILIDIEFGEFVKKRWHLHSLILPIVIVANLLNFCYIPELPFYFSVPIQMVAITILSWLVEVVEIMYQNRNGNVRSIELNLEDWKDVIVTSYMGWIGVFLMQFDLGVNIVLFSILIVFGFIFLTFFSDEK
jgi:hypothetical protein